MKTLAKLYDHPIGLGCILIVPLWLVLAGVAWWEQRKKVKAHG